MPVDPTTLYNNLLSQLRAQYPVIYADMMKRNGGSAAQADQMLRLVAQIAFPLATMLDSGGATLVAEEVEYRTLTATEIANKELTLTYYPNSAAMVSVDMIGAGAQLYGTDFTVTSNLLSWSGLRLDGILQEGDQMRITYTYNT